MSCVREVVIEVKRKAPPQYPGFVDRGQALGHDRDLPWFEGSDEGVFEFEWPDEDADL